jgi:hypothetical protein
MCGANMLSGRGSVNAGSRKEESQLLLKWARPLDGFGGLTAGRLGALSPSTPLGTLSLSNGQVCAPTICHDVTGRVERLVPKTL